MSGGFNGRRKIYMKIKVCGMREPGNIRAVEALGIDMIGLIFSKNSPRYVASVSSHAGIIPDYAGDAAGSGVDGGNRRCKRVGVFVDDTPQDIITAVYNYGLDYVQLHGNETPVMIDNLRRTIDPDIRPGIKFIKAISVGAADDVKRWREYRDVADLLLFDTKGRAAGGNGTRFDWAVLEAYDGDIPFLLSGGIGPDDAQRVLSFHHPKMLGIDLNSRFETSPAVKDVALIETFVKKINNI